MPRRFNTAGPCDPRFHYMLPASVRLPGARRLVERGDYFVVHAPRQTGKTTSLRALAAALRKEGRFVALHASCEVGEAAGEDFVAAQRALLAQLVLRANRDLPEELRLPDPLPVTEPEIALLQVLTAWSRAAARPVVLLLDEIDALRGASLRAVLRQLRAGFAERPDDFPWSVALCGLRDVRDYKAAAGGNPAPLGTASPFNVKVASLRVVDFTEQDVHALYAQHTQETGRPFTGEALSRAWELTRGQPWLVNALAREVTEEMAVAVDEAVTVDHLDQARERLVLARQTHLDSLVARLHEPRVRRIVGPLLAGETLAGDAYDDDFSYVRDLGLVAPDPPVRIANPIYREVVVRVLASVAEGNVVVDPRSFVRPDGGLDFPRLLAEFGDFWIQHGEILTAGMSYHEAAPQLVLMGFFHRVVNGGGYVEREYGIGRGRIDLLVRWPLPAGDGERRWQREAVELKVWRPAAADPLAQGLEQLDAYLARLGLQAGTLVVFDRRPSAPPMPERVRFDEAVTSSGRRVRVMRA